MASTSYHTFRFLNYNFPNSTVDLCTPSQGPQHYNYSYGAADTALPQFREQTLASEVDIPDDSITALPAPPESAIHRIIRRQSGQEKPEQAEPVEGEKAESKWTCGFKKFKAAFRRLKMRLKRENVAVGKPIDFDHERGAEVLANVIFSHGVGGPVELPVYEREDS